MLITASAPGSLMILGEHAVLHNHPAIVAAVDKRITVKLETRDDNIINIQSALGQTTCQVGEITLKSPFEFVLSALRKTQLDVGCDITIESEFSSTIGFGSSSAVTVATVAAVQYLKTQQVNHNAIFLKARQVLHTVQGMGSGADLAAGVYGGVLLYRQYPMLIEKIADTLPIVAVYSGHKVPTKTVVEMVERQRQDEPARYKQFYTDLENGALQSINAIKEEDWPNLGFCFNAAQDVLDQMNLSTNEIETIIDTSDEFDVYGAKISGSGLGDCVILLGDVPEDTYPMDEEQEKAGIVQVPMTIQTQGVMIHHD